MFSPPAWTKTLDMIHIKDQGSQALVLQKADGTPISEAESISLIEELESYTSNLTANTEQITIEGMKSFFQKRGYVMLTVEDDNPDYLNPENYDTNTYMVIKKMALGTAMVAVVVLAFFTSPFIQIVAITTFSAAIGTTIVSEGFAAFLKDKYAGQGGNLQDTITELVNQSLALAP